MKRCSRKTTPLNPIPLVSVVIVTCNGIEHLPGLLNSLKEQDYPNLEIIIIDNHSDDNSFAFIKENFPGIEVFRNPKNLGQFDQFSESFSACFAAVLLNRETIDKIGALDEFYKVYMS